jgi:hypothetical protein
MWKKEEREEIRKATRQVDKEVR